MTDTEQRAIQHLLLVNAFAGFCFDIKNWPCFLKDNNYKVYGLEWNFNNSNGEIVQPELIAKSRDNKHAILLECKSGTCDSAQLDRYSKVNIDDVVQRANISVENFDIILLTFHDNSQDALEKIKSNNYPFVVLGLGDQSLDRFMNDFKISALNDAINPKVDLEIKYLPENLISFSPDGNYPEGKIAKSIILAFIELLITGEQDTIDLESFVRKYIVRNNLFDCYQMTDKKQIIERCQKIARKIIKKYFFDYIEIRLRNNAEIQPNIYDVKKRPHNADEAKNISKEIKVLTRIADVALKDFGEKLAVSYQSELSEYIPPESNDEDIEIN